MAHSTSTPKQKRQLFVDIETFSSQPLPKCGVYRYSQAADFQILLVTYGYNGEELVTVDLACGEQLPPDFLSALEDPNVLKVAHNAQFERVCFSRYLGHWLDPHQWRCSMIMANYLTLPGKLADVAVALNLTERKMEEGKDLIRYFSVPCKATKANGGRTRNLPGDAPDKWELYKTYNRQDVETERAVVRALERYPLPNLEWELYALDQIINDRGVRIDKQLVRSALIVDSEFTQKAYQRAQEITGLENPSSVVQLKAWLADQDMPMETLAKKVVQEKAKDAEGIVAELLHLRLELSKTSVKKYEAMARTVCKDGRVHGVTQFYGASRTGRWAGRLVQLQNVPQNHLPDLDAAKNVVKNGDEEMVEMLYGSVPNTLSELIRTALIPKDGCRFLVADFSAIEARTLAWLAGEEWVLEEFRGKGKIYEATAARMYHVSADTIVKGNPNYAYRQKGKQATLACGYAGGVGAMKNMGATMPDEELQDIVEAWRRANPHIVNFWSAMESSARQVVDKKITVPVGKTVLYWKDGNMFMRLPSGRDLCYQGICYTDNRFGNRSLGYYMPSATGKMMLTETFGGKLVENCIAQGTLVLTDCGLLPIESISASHLIWDGEAFVSHEGLLDKGIQPVVAVDGIHMTPDHKILTEKGWIRCGSCNGLNWSTVSLPDRSLSCRKQSSRQTTLAMPLCLWKRSKCVSVRPEKEKVSNHVVRLHEKAADRRRYTNSWNVETPSLGGMALNETALPFLKPSSLPQLWGTRHYCLSGMVTKLRQLLERHGTNISPRHGLGSHRQQSRLFSEQLPLGISKREQPKQTFQPVNQQPSGDYDCFGIVRENRHRRNDNALSAGSQLATRITVRETGRSEFVYDIKNCGPRHRFTVFDPITRQFHIVSNCTQAVARDILANSMLELEKAGYHIVFHVHDEVILEVPYNHGSLEDACAIMGIPPAWASNLPLRADGDELEYYRKM